MLERIQLARRALVFFSLIAAGATAGACGGNVVQSAGTTSGSGGSSGTGGSTSVCPATACVCPAALPADGSPCDTCCTQTCSYGGQNNCGPTAQCTSGGTWSVVAPHCPANPPCSVFTSAQECAGASYCRWLVPACVQVQSFTAGCFDVADCVPGSVCASGQTCTTVDTDPCWDWNCAACAGGTANICWGPG